jgi:hypothetical protein
LVQFIRYKGDLIGFYFQYEINKPLFAAIALNIELCGYDLLYFPHIMITDVSFVRSRMDGYAIGAEALCVNSGLCDVWVIASTAIAKGCKLVDVY